MHQAVKVRIMHRNITGLAMILISSIVNFSGQLLLRRASGRILTSDTNQDMKLIGYFLLLRKLFPPSGAFLLGVILLFSALCIWVLALGFIRFSIGFPIYISLSFCFTMLHSTAITKSNMGWFQYLGLGLLLLGIVLLTRK